MAEKRNVVLDEKLIGKVVIENGRYIFLSKTNMKFDIKQDEMAKRLAYSGEICIFEFDKNPKLSSDIIGKITQIMGKEGDPIPEGLAIATVHNLISPFGKNAMDQTSKLPTEVTKEQWEGYRDLRNIDFVTIDPDTAKDFDDSVYAEKNPDGSYTMRVAIANVANYIEEGSPLWYEILDRGNSAYLGSQVYPMLPEEISNGLCSINEGTDRVVMCTTAKISSKGEIMEYSLEPAVIRSRHRLTYKEADYIRFGHCDTVQDQSVFAGLGAKTARVKPSIDALFEVSDILTKQRDRRGAISINSYKPHFVLDSTGTEVATIEEEQGEKATKVIESSAILTNEISGEIAKRLGIPTMYRNHSLPDKASAEILRDKLAEFGITLNPGASAESYRSILKFVKGKPYEEITTSMILKSLKDAYYSDVNDGHFGLGIRENEFYDTFMKERGYNGSVKMADEARMNYFKETGSYNGLKFEGDISHSAYAYSTSPIRNAPSYIIQTQLLNYIMTGNIKFNGDVIAELGDKFSATEKNAAMAEKEYDNLLASIWASKHIGESFSGRIVNFFPDGLVVKTYEPKNVSITVPYEDIRSVNMNQAMIDSMVIKCGNKKSFNHKGSKGKRTAKNTSPLNLGDTLNGIVIYKTTAVPPRIYATEDGTKVRQMNNKEIVSNGKERGI